MTPEAAQLESVVDWRVVGGAAVVWTACGQGHDARGRPPSDRSPRRHASFGSFTGFLRIVHPPDELSPGKKSEPSEDENPWGGQRAPDVESFGRAIQVSKITRLLQPSEGLHLNFLQYWMSLDYGALRQLRGHDFYCRNVIFCG